MLPAVNLLPFIGPVLFLILGALATLVAEPFLGKQDKHKFLPWIGTIAAAMSGVALFFTAPGHLHGVFALDPARAGLLLVLLVVLVLGLAALQRNLSSDGFEGGEPYVLVQLATIGAALMVMASQSISLFVGMELMSLAIYPLVGMRRKSSESAEAVLKYFAMGAVFSALFLYGASLCYGATGTVGFGGTIAEGRAGVFNLGFVFMSVGLLFKIGMAPFHFWSPDAYTGASSGTTAFMAGAVKVGAIAALGNLWMNFLVTRAGFPLNSPLSLKVTIPPMLFYQMSPEAFASIKSMAVLLFGILGLLSIAIGSLSVLGQVSVRRLLAFSGVANAGFMCLGFLLPSLARGYIDMSVTWYYLAGYALATTGALAALSALTGAGDAGDHLPALSGAARRSPLIGAVLTVFLASLAGLPPMAGFVAKFQLFHGLLLNVFSGLVQGVNPVSLLAIPGLALVLALVSAAAYFKVIVAIWSQPGQASREPESVPVLLGWTVTLTAVALVALAIFPKHLFGA
ncbi:MAG: NADH-quinone oxidoreductase subunit N [Fibrobacterota bacterium]